MPAQPKGDHVPHNLIARAGRDTVPVAVVEAKDYAGWLKAQPPATQLWLKRSGYAAEPGDSALIPAADGGVAGAVFVPDWGQGPWSWSGLAAAMPPGSYRLGDDLGDDLSADWAGHAALGWALAGYAYTRYRNTVAERPSLVWPANADRDHVTRTAAAIALVRDLVTTPAEDMGPSELAAAAGVLARPYRARVQVIAGDKLLAANYPAIHAVGRASDDAPRLIDLRWGRAEDTKVTLVGKGVCFDTGGLDLKPAGGMRLMKKDMGGAAHVLGLASMIMAAGLPVRLRVLIAAVENAVAGNAIRPLDVIRTRKGLTVEIGNTDAEGRLVLADCLTEACSEAPDLLIDFATLTGAARVALGVEVPALFTNDDALAHALAAAAVETVDPLWRLPLHDAYRAQLNSPVADLNNIGSGGYGGAITAALFLREFIDPAVPWAHFDVMAWNERSRPGRPEGGEAMAMRAAFAVIAAHARARAHRAGDSRAEDPGAGDSRARVGAGVGKTTGVGKAGVRKVGIRKASMPKVGRRKPRP